MAATLTRDVTETKHRESIPGTGVGAGGNVWGWGATENIRAAPPQCQFCLLL